MDNVTFAFDHFNSMVTEMIMRMEYCCPYIICVAKILSAYLNNGVMIIIQLINFSVTFCVPDPV